jgi:hypothetical protein
VCCSRTIPNDEDFRLKRCLYLNAENAAMKLILEAIFVVYVNVCLVPGSKKYDVSTLFRTQGYPALC